MGQRQAEIQLTYLERVNLHRWRFKAKPHAPFDQLIRDFITVHLFQMREVYFTLTSGDYSKQHAIEISDEGMWFLSHLFINWEEMRGKAEVYTSGTYQSLPRCSRCGKECVTECAHCNTPFCEQCYDLHVFNLRVEQDRPFQTFTFRFEHTQGTAPHIEDLLRRYQGINLGQSVPVDVRKAHTLLGITKEQPTEEEIRGAFRTKVKAIHPDTGGRGGDMDNLTKAKERALKFIGIEL